MHPAHSTTSYIMYIHIQHVWKMCRKMYLTEHNDKFIYYTFYLFLGCRSVFLSVVSYAQPFANKNKSWILIFIYFPPCQHCDLIQIVRFFNTLHYQTWFCGILWNTSCLCLNCPLFDTVSHENHTFTAHRVRALICCGFVWFTVKSALWCCRRLQQGVLHPEPSCTSAAHLLSLLTSFLSWWLNSPLLGYRGQRIIVFISRGWEWTVQSLTNFVNGNITWQKDQVYKTIPGVILSHCVSAVSH